MKNLFSTPSFRCLIAFYTTVQVKRIKIQFSVKNVSSSEILQEFCIEKHFFENNFMFSIQFFFEKPLELTNSTVQF